MAFAASPDMGTLQSAWNRFCSRRSTISRPSGLMQCGLQSGGQNSRTLQTKYSATSASITPGASSQVL
eukprot:2194683-Rhodomonas_salina.1